jgi:hypothetical protein
MSNNPFGNLGTDGLEEARDSLGGGGALESGLYTGKIKLAYAGASSGGARFLAIVVDVNGRDYRETLYVTNKAGENYYTRGDKKIPLPGFTTANDIALLSTGQPLGAQDIQEKVAEIYNFDERKEIPTKVQAVTSIMGKSITLGILKVIEDKTKKNETTGTYEPTGETRDVNVIDKVFHTDTGKTVSEFTTKAEKAEFKDRWAEKHTGKTQNKAKGATGKPGVPGQAAGIPGGASKAPSKSLFG